MLSLFERCFSLVEATGVNADAPRMMLLPRKARNELVLASILFPLMTAELSTFVTEEIFATDASDEYGAIVSTTRDEDVATALFRTNYAKSTAPRMKSALEALELKEHGDFLDEKPYAEGPKKPLAFRFAFVEIFAGAAGITKEVAAAGFAVCTPIHLSRSPEFDLRCPRVMEWLSYLIAERLVMRFAIEPPCATFSVMRRPALRSKECPYGFNLEDEKTLTGNVLCVRGLQCLHLGKRYRVSGLMEAPWSTKAKYLPPYKKMMESDGVDTTRCDSCRYGSPRLKSFLFVVVHLSLRRLQRRCCCTSKHVQIQGSLTKASATYTEELASEIALSFAEEFRKKLEFQREGPVEGLENQLVNEVACSSQWKLRSVWKYRKKETHINIKEMAAVYRLCMDLAARRKPVRVSVLLDSNVVRGAILKGRSSSQSLSSLLRRIGSCVVAAGLQLAVPFCPTRLNPADDPTRLVELRKPSSSLGLKSWTKDQIFDLAETKKLRRWASNWQRLVLLTLGPLALMFSDYGSYRKAEFFEEEVNQVSSRVFDSTKGFPGEGPHSKFGRFLLCCLLENVVRLVTALCMFSTGLLGLFPLSLSWISCFALSSFGLPSSSQAVVRSPWRLRLALVVGFCFVHRVEAMEHVTAGDLRRAGSRAVEAPLPQGRFVTTQTGNLREGLLRLFLNWIDSQGVDSSEIFENSYHTVEDINTLLAAYGRFCFEQGKTLNRYSETINAVASWKPHLRRVLQGAWDVSYAWARREPPVHRLSVPSQVLMAMLAVALCWGWTGGLLRPGEIFQAFRSDLFLPSDGGYVDGFSILTIKEPKTSFSAARHQASKIDIPDVVQVLEICYQRLRPHEKLWSASPQTLRTRFRQLLEAVHLSSHHTPGIKQLELSSLRPGGATWLMMQTESGDLVMRRGRWASYRMMSIYVQEVLAVTYLSLIPLRSKKRVLYLAGMFPSVLQRAEQLHVAMLHPSLWNKVFAPM